MLTFYSMVGIPYLELQGYVRMASSMQKSNDSHLVSHT